MANSNFLRTAILFSQVKNEQGAALIIVLVVLLLLTILGATMLDSTTSELKIAGNYRNSEETFYVADSAMEFAKNFGGIYSSIIPDSSNNWPAPGQGRILGANDFSNSGNNNSENINYNRITITNPQGRQNTADVKVVFVCQTPPPPSSGYGEDAGIGSSGSTRFNFNNYLVDVIASGPNNSRVELDSQIGKPTAF